MSDYEKVWDEHWKRICTHEDGTLNLDQIKRELSDYAFMLDQVPKVYSEVTGGTLSKTNYYANGVISCFEQHRQDTFDMWKEEALKVLEEEKEENYASEDNDYALGLGRAIEVIKEYM